MNTRATCVGLTMALGLVPLTACKKKQPAATSGHAEPVQTTAAKTEVDTALLGPYQPLPTQAILRKGEPISEEQTALGRMLYYDTRLSKNHDVSCNSCHQLDNFGVDNKPLSEGHRKQLGTRNSPTVYNAAGHFVQFWDGRAADVEQQAEGPMLNAVEMAMPNKAAVVKVLKSIPGYAKPFKAAFPQDKDPVTFDNVTKAIGAFERKLLTPSRWDQYLEGEKDALSADEKEGFKQFIGAGCPTCHTGAYLGGHMYQKAGLVKAWPNQKDQGRFEVTKVDSDRMMFKVPSLRNVEKTAPYFHDGSVAKLDEAVKMMANYQLGRTLNDEQAQSIIVFLKSLTGTIPTEYIKQPALPKSGPKTPKPDPA